MSAPTSDAPHRASSPALRLVAALLVLAALADLPVMIGTLSKTHVYRKDLFQDYLAALRGPRRR